MFVSSPMGKVRFTDCLRAILHESYGEAEAETYAYYQKHCAFMFKVEADIVEFCPHYFKLHSAVRLFECVCYTHEEVELFEIVDRKSGDEVALLSRAQFFERRQDFYENEGRRVNSKKGPMSILYSSENILDYLSEDMGVSLFSRGFIPNEFAWQMDTIYREMKKRNYLFFEDTTVKEFYRDIIEPLYPQMSTHDQNFYWKFFKPKGSLVP